VALIVYDLHALLWRKSGYVVNWPLLSWFLLKLSWLFWQILKKSRWRIWFNGRGPNIRWK